MALPVLTYSTLNGKRVVSVSGSVKLPTNRTSAPAGTHDLKTTNGNVTIKLGNGLAEPLDVAAMQDKL
jgi:hypothetical protein